MSIYVPEYSTTPQNAASDIVTLPTTDDGWRSLYLWLEKAYNLDKYEVGDLKRLHLFRALDDSGDAIHETARTMTDVRHIVDTDIQALSGGERMSLDVAEGVSDADYAAGEAVWRRSRVRERSEDFARVACAIGDLWLYPFLDERGQGRIADYDPIHVSAEYDVQDGSRLERVLIEMDYLDEGITREGRGDGSALRQLVRYMDATEIHTMIDGQTVDAESGPHGLGVVPMVHVPFSRALRQPSHGISAGHQYYRMVAVLDSIVAQAHASGNRYADPMIVLKGASITGAIKRFGRYLQGLAREDDVSYLDTPMQGVGAMLEVYQALREAIREAPEFLFTESGANASGTALNFRATAFVKKMAGPMLRYRMGLAAATDMAVSLEQRRAIDPDLDRFAVELAPALPVAKSAEVADLIAIKNAGGMTTADFVRSLQRLDYIREEVEPDDYTLEILEENQRTARAFGLGGGMGQDEEDTSGPADEADNPNEDEE